MSPKLPTMSPISSKTDEAWKFRPRRYFTCLIMIITAAALANPMETDDDMKEDTAPVTRKNVNIESNYTTIKWKIQ